MTTFNGKNYSIETTDAGQFVLIHPVSENETFDSLLELLEAHPVCDCDEVRECFGTITEDNYYEYFPLDYAVVLAKGCEDISLDSVLVSKLDDSCKEQGYCVPRSVLRNILVDCITPE